MIQLIRTDSQNQDFVELVKKLDEYLSISDGEDHLFYDQFNKIDTINHVVVAYFNEKPVGCGAIKEYDDATMEVKRMFTSNESRGKGVASLILFELEKWAVELLYNRCLLETGIRQVEAIGLYKKNKYAVVDNYGQYVGIKDSVCFEKKLL
ncbi:acetyltransferase (GNAT) family protein [Tenacibaculum adriaticum]|uniref:Acetyltransferase (GNAT) family protein n=1 Tax=Tenacibaculum adriaticum TaxID=413713 RepID=A0A5S5DZF2_9FLAO|nr:GNAT family N-acetyltransferase [Tenacibaculum adriaticum]TYP99919.1 acetyltransferase (GNAT) family protein [Tenacibaculum adriaticum]